ncbi:acyl-CoA thioesterase [Alteromonas halophila]|uniref:4-hydroxybenzoyl-CoA thioesterase n=1 Tax=Alteromonas halophila TaxID=516698 RepID=A0A918JR54_9ALTE|nr:thioesterase family protein [Alteromonas halophila]GGW95038.1 4-hydroxybenzoyl-CoA thioesterase [Alteromonas halophila]
MSDSLPWRRPAPFTQTWQITQAHLDHYNHVNNVAYLSQLEKLAWAHSNALGLRFEDYQACDRAMVIRRHELEYLQPAHLDDTLICATWIIDCDNKLSLTRQFQFICTRREKTVFEAQTRFICVSLSTGVPKRMPQAFKTCYGAACVSEQA